MLAQPLRHGNTRLSQRVAAGTVPSLLQVAGEPKDRAAKDRSAAQQRLRRRTLKEALGPESQAEMYLTRALEELHHSANAPDLWVPVAGLLRGSLLEGAQAVGTAKDGRLRFLRGTVLYAALAIEAFANELLPARDFDAVDRLEVPDKLLIGTRLASGQSRLSRGAQPLQDVAVVVKTRNRLVHAHASERYSRLDSRC